MDAACSGLTDALETSASTNSLLAIDERLLSSPDISSHSYRIEEMQQSLSAALYFVRHTVTGESFVIKQLCTYSDTRYSLETLEERQQCQLDAIRRNRIFSQDFPLALAPLHRVDLKQGIICTGEMIANPDEGSFEPGNEYGLLMQRLPVGRRLDCLLETEPEDSLKQALLRLTAHIARIHERLEALEDGADWGSCLFLEEKRRQNLELLDFLLADEIVCATYPELRGSLPSLKHMFERMATPHLQTCFEQRVAEKRIKFCHGDVKSPHIWLMLGSNDGETQESIKFLDAIDFNPLFNRIDTLSDFAMFVADIQARTGSLSLVEHIVESYLRATHQDDDKVARTVLDYYIIEKAIVGTGISFLYDGLPHLGQRFLAVAESRLKAAQSVVV